jgi:hypothetical protein
MKKERGRGNLDRIPGVRRGFQKGESIEAGRERIVARARAEMPREKATLLIIESSKEDFLDLPILGPSNLQYPSSWVPRYDRDTGAIITTKWRTGTTETNVEGRQALKEPERFSVISKPKHAKNVDLTSFPKSWSVARLIPQKIEDGIEAAMRQQDEVRKDYGVFGGIEQEKIAGLFVEIQKLTEPFLQGGISKNELSKVAEKTSMMIENLGISKVKGNIYERMINSLLRAGQEDRLGRVNPLISRTLLRSAYLDAVKREVLARLSREKANNVFNLLYVERFTTRALLENARDSIEKLAGLRKEPGHKVLTEDHYRKDPIKNISDEEISELRRDLKAIVKTNLRSVRVAPYLIIARLSEAMLLSPMYMKKKDKSALGKVIKRAYLNSALEMTSAEEYIMKRDPASAATRLRQVHSLINAVLEDPDNLVYMVFD